VKNEMISSAGTGSVKVNTVSGKQKDSGIEELARVEKKKVGDRGQRLGVEIRRLEIEEKRLKLEEERWIFEQVV